LQVTHFAEQLAARRAAEREAREHEGDLPAVAQLRQSTARLVRGRDADDVVVARVAGDELALDPGEVRRVVVDCEDDRRAYPYPEIA
jgi:hypothetical protein